MPLSACLLPSARAVSRHSCNLVYPLYFHGMKLYSLFCGLLMMAAAALCFAFYHHMALKYFGGITGDLAGFYVCVSELAMVLAVVTGNRIAGLIG